MLHTGGQEKKDERGGWRNPGGGAMVPASSENFVERRAAWEPFSGKSADLGRFSVAANAVPH